MPDTEISKLPPLSSAQLRGDDVLAIADVSMVETKKVRADDLVAAGLSSVTAGTIDPNILNWAILDSDSISGDDLADESIADEKLIADTITARVIAPNAIGASELADASVDTAALQVGAVDNGALGTNSVDDRVVKDGGISTDNLAGSSVTVEKLSLNNDDLPGSVIAGGTITTEELAPNLPGSILANGAIGSDQIANGSIVNSKLSINSVATINVDDLAITDAKILNVNGAKIADLSVEATKFSPAAFNRGLDSDGTSIGIANAVTAATTSGITWNAQGLVTGAVPLVGPDLPVATDSSIGGVSVSADSGLAVSSLGELSVDNDIAAGTSAGISYNEHGLITSTVPLEGTDLPVATTTDLGAVIVPTAGNNPLTVNTAGEIKHALTGFGANTGLASVDVDEYGHITNGNTVLATSQVPPLDASQITTGTFPTARLADDSVLAKKLADYSTCLMQEDFPGNSTDYFLGMLWWQPSTAQLRVYSRGSAGNNWSPVGFGALQANNLRWGGVFDASTGTVSIVTDFGTTAGLIAGGAIPAPSNELSGLYLICQTEGNNVNQPDVSANTFTPGDWLLCINETQGYIQIDAGATGGGGGGSSYLSQLLDVSLTSLQDGQRLQADASGIWTNTDVMDGGTF